MIAILLCALWYGAVVGFAYYMSHSDAERAARRRFPAPAQARRPAARPEDRIPDLPRPGQDVPVVPDENDIL